jgi:hypothetical protein
LTFLFSFQSFQSAQSLYAELNDTFQELLFPLGVPKSVPSTPAKATPAKVTPAKAAADAKKSRGDKRDANGVVVSADDGKRKRGASLSLLADETAATSSAPGTPTNKKRKRN